MLYVIPLCVKCIIIKGIHSSGGGVAVKSRQEKNSNTFIIKILERRHSTWQGSVTWADRQQTQYFRSALELLKLIDEALDEKEELEGGCHEK